MSQIRKGVTVRNRRSMTLATVLEVATRLEDRAPVRVYVQPLSATVFDRSKRPTWWAAAHVEVVE